MKERKPGRRSSRHTARLPVQRPVLRVVSLISLTVLIAILAGYGVSRMVRRQAELRLRRGHALQEIERLVPIYRDILTRHPDLPLTEQSAWLTSFLSRPAAERADRVGELERRLMHLRVDTAAAVGADPRSPFKTFTANGFRRFYDHYHYDHVIEPRGEHPEPPAITGDAAADRHIRTLAEARGYRLRPVVADPSRLVEVEGRPLQPEIAQAWRIMQQSARAEGIHLALISGFRSPERQRRIFLTRLRTESAQAMGHPASLAEIRAGTADAVLESILQTSSIPGYSKHHTGYTIDITDAAAGLPFTDFARTQGYHWISAANYRNAKRFGFIPSYPPGASRQGPDPEAWEFVWVGKENLVRDSWWSRNPGTDTRPAPAARAQQAGTSHPTPAAAE